MSVQCLACWCAAFAFTHYVRDIWCGCVCVCLLCTVDAEDCRKLGSVLTALAQEKSKLAKVGSSCS